jgi:hypothetical protein
MYTAKLGNEIKIWQQCFILQSEMGLLRHTQAGLRIIKRGSTIQCRFTFWEFERVCYKKVLIKSHFMHKVWNNWIPKTPLTLHLILRENLSWSMRVLNYVRSSWTHPRIKCDRTVDDPWPQCSPSVPARGRMLLLCKIWKVNVDITPHKRWPPAGGWA